MRIQSNIKGLIRQMTRLRALVPEALEKSVSPAKWSEVARNHARLALEALAKNDAERAMIPSFIQTVTAVMIGGGTLRLSIAAPSNPAADVADMVHRRMDYADEMARPGPKRRVGLGEDDAATAALLDQAILDFVIEEKRLTEDEVDEPPESIAARLKAILFNGQLSLVDRLPLANAIQDYIKRFWYPAHLGGPVPDVGHWLPAVLNAWRVMFLTNWPPLIRQELRSAWRRSQRELL